VGHYPDRTEAEAMQLSGYSEVSVTPWETASGGKAVICRGATSCSASVSLHDAAAGWCELAVQYFDPSVGTAEYQVWINDQPVASWNADLHLPSAKLDGHTAVRFVVSGLAIRPGDILKVSGKGRGGNPAALDYVELTHEK
jgi:alpha-glucuronidase